MAPLLIALLVATVAPAAEQPQPRGYSVPLIDLAADSARQTIVDREAGQYLGHVSTLLLEDGKTILCVYPKGHGKGAIVYKRSTDGGRTWSERLATPKSWETSRETPTLFRTVDAAGKKRVLLFSGLYPIRMSVSEDDGQTWSELAPIGEFGGIVAMGDVIKLNDKPGHYAALFHDDGRFFKNAGKASGEFVMYQTDSTDGGLTWSAPREIWRGREVHLCEPGAVRSPDGKQIAILLRENRRVRNSHVMFSDDEARTWSPPRELPAALTGDRHTARYAKDGRLVVTFRDQCYESPTKGDWVAWVGRYEDIAGGTEGQYRVRLMDNTKAADCCYPGAEVLPGDGAMVMTTYGHWTKGQPPYIASVRLRLEEVDGKAGAMLESHAARPAEFVKKLGDYRPVLKFDDGADVKTESDWARRRAEILRYWHSVMGEWPPLLQRPKVETLESVQRDGYAQHKVRVEVAPEQTVDGYLLVPPGDGPFPAVVVPFYDAETSAALHDKYPLLDFGRQLTRRGFVTLSIGSPGGDARKPDPGKPVWQPLSYLAYVAANCHTALAQMPNVDPQRIGIVGHSYGGKWALFASCLYDKFAAAAWSDPGIVFDESRGNVNYWEPWYLGRQEGVTRKPGIPSQENPRTGAYKKMIDERRDLHELHALMAPRPFLVSGGSEDPAERWIPLNQTVAVNKLLGQEGRVFMTNRPGHTPTPESNAILYAFFEHALGRRR